MDPPSAPGGHLAGESEVRPEEPGTAPAPVASRASSVRAGEWWNRTTVPARQAVASLTASWTVACP